MNDPNVIPDGLTEFRIGAEKVKLDLFEAAQEVNRLTEVCDGKTDYSHLTMFAAWLKSKGWPDVTMSQANWVWERVNFEAAESRRVFLERLKSLSSMDSTPPA